MFEVSRRRFQLVIHQRIRVHFPAKSRQTLDQLLLLLKINTAGCHGDVVIIGFLKHTTTFTADIGRERLLLPRRARRWLRKYGQNKGVYKATETN